MVVSNFVYYAITAVKGKPLESKFYDTIPQEGKLKNLNKLEDRKKYVLNKVFKILDDPAYS